MTKDKLAGQCKTCKYGSKCLGGCPNTQLTMNGDIYSENQYCSYNVALKNSEEKIAGYSDGKNCGDFRRLRRGTGNISGCRNCWNGY
jgi:hypothetical protein